MAELQYDATMPSQFVVKRNVDGREGYVFFKSMLAQGTGDAQPWRKISAMKHLSLYYNIHTDNPQSDFRRCNIVKNGGTVRREIQWRHSNERLHHGGRNWPVLTITGFQHFPTWHARQHFAPITTPLPVTPALLPAPAPGGHQDQNMNKKYPIPTIPQHAIRALLTQAVYNDEQCPIMDVPVDVSNGAITSCFHIFDKAALGQWLSQPGSGQKCPVCNQPCNMYCLRDEVEEVIEVEIQGED